MSLRKGVRQAIEDGINPKDIEAMTPKEPFDYIDSIGLTYYDSWLGQKEIRDAWVNPFKITISSSDFVIESPGKDKQYGTKDDMAETFLISP